jgi:hypothetical protein
MTDEEDAIIWQFNSSRGILSSPYMLLLMTEG